MLRFIKPLIFCILIFENVSIVSQETGLKEKSEKIIINEDSSFDIEYTILLKKSSEPRTYPIFYDTELEKVSEIALSEVKGKRLKPLTIKRIFEEEVKLDYIASKKIKSVFIPAEMEVSLTYLVSCKELMYFSSLPFFSYQEIDTLKYEITVPKKFEFVHNIIHKDSLSFYSIDSTNTDFNTTWKIKAAPKKVAEDPLQFFGIYKNMKVPLMRTLVMPNSYKNDPKKYMNDWYLENISSKKGLDASVKQKIDELTANTTDPKEILHIIYNYMKRNFKYVAIEIGMGAFIPSHANEVFTNKQGDCKDLSNFLSETLKYKGIKSDIALAATFNHISDCDFPSLSSANHVICVAYINEEKILLDPTDIIHLVGTPVQSLQNRSILIINEEGGNFYEVAQFSPQQNEIYYQLDLAMDENNAILKGTFTTNYNGISSNYLKRNLHDIGETEFKNFSKSFYEEVLGNQSISDVTLINDLQKLQFTGAISITGKTFIDGSNRYLFIDFLPKLIENESRQTLFEGTYLRNPFHKKVVSNIQLNEPIEDFKPITHSFEGAGISLNVTIRKNSDLEIQCNYDFVIDHLFVEKENISNINEILNAFKKILNDPIVLKKKKS
ncbi:MAG: transglutaminase domain-containing protein [Polaribacter sp.]|nr:transglutaminase domain-containing protein [Polaribacter sp.]